MAAHRMERVNEQLKRDISRILLEEVKDPRVGGVAVTRVSTAPDLTLARIFVHVQGDEAERKETMKGLRAATAFMRTALAQRIDLRRVPELRFELDRSLEHALRIERLLEEAATGEEREDPEEARGPEGAEEGEEA